MVKYDGTCTKTNMIKLLKEIFVGTNYEVYHEGMYAHQHKDNVLRERITSEYKEKYMPVPTPLSHPELYDPLNPPKGWAYDPYYECWVHNE